MGDIKILRKDGWEELPEIVEAIVNRELNIEALWRAAARADVRAVQQELLDAGYDLKGTLKDFRAIALPDDILGESFRVWVKYK